jgi:hypothetical protein
LEAQVELISSIFTRSILAGIFHFHNANVQKVPSSRNNYFSSVTIWLWFRIGYLHVLRPYFQTAITSKQIIEKGPGWLHSLCLNKLFPDLTNSFNFHIQGAAQKQFKSVIVLVNLVAVVIFHISTFFTKVCEKLEYFFFPST